MLPLTTRIDFPVWCTFTVLSSWHSFGFCYLKTLYQGESLARVIVILFWCLSSSDGADKASTKLHISVYKGAEVLFLSTTYGSPQLLHSWTWRLFSPLVIVSKTQSYQCTCRIRYKDLDFLEWIKLFMRCTGRSLIAFTILSKPAAVMLGTDGTAANPRKLALYRIRLPRSSGARIYLLELVKYCKYL